MKLFFEITSGDRKGSRIEIRDELSIGRKGTDVILRDPKVSSRHAVVDERDHGFYLNDIGSANGLKIDGNRVSEVHLIPGVSVQIGRTQLVVIDLDEVGSSPGKPIVKGWQDTVRDLLAKVEDTLENSQRTKSRARMFETAIDITVIAGPQLGDSWTLVYGPREVGSDSLDVRLIEEGIPKTAFVLSQASNGVMLTAEKSDAISVNGAGGKQNYVIADGDEVSIRNTVLKIKLRDL